MDTICSACHPDGTDVVGGTTHCEVCGTRVTW